MQPLSGDTALSNSLTDLAARINAEHDAVVGRLSEAQN
jgi:hypothetical protein